MSSNNTAMWSKVTLTCDPGLVFPRGSPSVTLECTAALEWDRTPGECHGRFERNRTSGECNERLNQTGVLESVTVGLNRTGLLENARMCFLSRAVLLENVRVF